MRTYLIPILLTVLSTSLSAQASPDQIHHKNDCRLAAQTLRSGHPGPKTEWALSIITSCGNDGATALAEAIRAMRISTDTATLEYMRYQAGSFRDANVFAAVLEVAGDPGASVPARVYALLASQDIANPGLRYSFADATTDLDEEGRPRCDGLWRRVSDHRQVNGAPLPPDFRSRVYDVRRQIRSDSTSPRLVRAATFCPF